MFVAEFHAPELVRPRSILKIIVFAPTLCSGGMRPLSNKKTLRCGFSAASSMALPCSQFCALRASSAALRRAASACASAAWRACLFAWAAATAAPSSPSPMPTPFARACALLRRCYSNTNAIASGRFSIAPDNGHQAPHDLNLIQLFHSAVMLVAFSNQFDRASARAANLF